jgi:hypothetical protein
MSPATMKIHPITGLDKPLCSRRLRLPEFLNNRHMKVVRLSALGTGHLYPLGDVCGTHLF